MVRPNKVKDDYPVRWIPISEIGVVWPDAQRPLNERKVLEMVQNFDPDGLGVLAVAEKNGKGLYHPLDGQHRKEMLVRLGWGDQLVKAEIHTDVHDAKTAAARFLLLNNSRKPGALDQFRAAVTAGHERETAINQIVRSCGYRIGIDADSSRAIAAVTALAEVYRRGPDILRETLNTISATWRDDVDATSGIIIRGIGLTLETYGNALDLKRFRERVGKKYTAGNLLAATRTQKPILGLNAPQALMWVVVHCYNHGLKPDAHLPLP